jgi:CheY-like chemotaxis protein
VTARPLSIAVLDDEAHMRRALHRLLCLHGHDVALFDEGHALIHAQSSHPFDCIVLDLHMPGLSGFEVMQLLSETSHHPPMIVITGKDEPGNEARARELGATAYLLKPVDEAPLMAAIAIGTRAASQSHGPR